MQTPGVADKAKFEISPDCEGKVTSALRTSKAAGQGSLPGQIFLKHCSHGRVFLGSWVGVSRSEQPYQLLCSTMAMQSKPEKLAELPRERVPMHWGILCQGRVGAGQFPLPAPGLDYSWGKCQQCLCPESTLI